MGGGATVHEFIFAAKMRNTLAARAINGVGVGGGTMDSVVVVVEGWSGHFHEYICNYGSQNTCAAQNNSPNMYVRI